MCEHPRRRPKRPDRRPYSQAAVFSYDTATLPGAKPWTSKEFKNNPEEFQFVVIGDRTGGANLLETFKLAMGQINLLQPEFVINVGDVIEGYSEDKAELNAEWDEIDESDQLARHAVLPHTGQPRYRQRHRARVVS